MNRKHRILIAGPGGVVGAAAVEHFASLPDWQVTALSRRRLELPDTNTRVNTGHSGCAVKVLVTADRLRTECGEPASRSNT